MLRCYWLSAFQAVCVAGERVKRLVLQPTETAWRRDNLGNVSTYTTLASRQNDIVYGFLKKITNAFKSSNYKEVAKTGFSVEIEGFFQGDVAIASGELILRLRKSFGH